MKSMTKFACLLFAGLAATGLAEQTPTPGFSRIVSEVDVGGDYLEVVNAATFESDVNAFIDLALGVVSSFEPLSQQDREMIAKVRKIVKSAGFLSVRGSGSSVCPQPDGSYLHRSFLLVEKGKNPMLDLFASVKRPVTVENYLPRSTAAALSLSADVKGTALFVADAMDELGLEEAQTVRNFCESPDDTSSLFDSIAPGTLLALTLDPSKTIRIPEVTTRVPAPGLLVVQAVRNGQPWSMLQLQMIELAKETRTAYSLKRSSAFPDVDRLTFNVPSLAEFGITPVLAYDAKSGVVLFASSERLLNEALAAGLKKQGRLLDEPTFASDKSLSAGISGLLYLSPRVVPAVAAFALSELGEKVSTIPPSVEDFLADPPDLWFAGTYVRLEDGVRRSGRASFGAGNTCRMLLGRGALSSLGVAGVLSAVLIP